MRLRKTRWPKTCTNFKRYSEKMFVTAKRFLLKIWLAFLFFSIHLIVIIFVLLNYLFNIRINRNINFSKCMKFITVFMNLWIFCFYPRFIPFKSRASKIILSEEYMPFWIFDMLLSSSSSIDLCIFRIRYKFFGHSHERPYSKPIMSFNNPFQKFKPFPVLFLL